ncbi:Rab GTPase-activating protein 1 [Halotydeus destructor]|nr:Rab GTPase-activating protein 1 [Halotydeus destructor]
MSRTLTTELEEDKERLLDEVEQLKEVCRRELGRAEAEITRNAQIISDYKQITATMSGRLEKEEAKNKNLLSQMSSAFSNCDKCSAIVVSLTNGRATEQSKSKDNSDQGNTVEQRVRELELELAQTKLALVEAECQNQDVQHELSAAHSQLEASKNNWYQRTVRSIKETKESLVHRKDVAIMNKSLSFTRENSRGEQ